MINRFLLLSVGPCGSLHRQANFAILSVLASLNDSEDISIHVVTDQPEWYSWLQRYVDILPVDGDLLADWKGSSGYFFRIKLRAMQYLREEYGEGNLIFIDTDIVCQDDLTDLFGQLASGQCFMHTKEYTLASKRGTAQEMWRQARHRTYGSLTVNEESSMWNSGVVAIPDHLWERCLSAALMCCDEMCERGVKPKIIEQFSLSLALEKEQRLMPADRWFIHYWGNKPPWNALIATFLADVLLKQESVETACERMTTLPLNMPVTIKRTRLERLANSVTKRLRRRDNIVEQTVTEWLTR